MKTQRPRRRRKIIAGLLLIVLLAGTGFGFYRYNRPLPALAASVTPPSTSTQTVSLPWTASGESAISTDDNKVLGQGENANKVVPTASIAKLITILTVLEKHPLKAGESGPTITLTANDVALYNKYNALDGSTVVVSAGEQITEYQMLQAMLLPSANNIADSLAIWAYGSLPEYRKAAQDTVNRLGMGRTLVGSDASGFSPDTTSTANDLVLLGEAALKESVITEIAAQRTAVIPVAGAIYNSNILVGENGITGLKTGTSDEAGYCFLFSATNMFNNGQSETFVGVILGSANNQSRFMEAEVLLDAVYAGYKDVVIAKADQVIGTVKSEWGEEAKIAPQKDVSTFVWQGDASSTTAELTVNNQTSLTDGQKVGSIEAGSESIPLVTTAEIEPPSFWWRLFH